MGEILKDYLLKRPMLLSGILCALVSAICYYYKFTVLVFGLLSVLSLAVLICFKAKFKTVFPFVAVGIVVLSTLITYGKIDKLNKLDGKTEQCSIILTNINYKNGDYTIAESEVISGDKLKRGTKLFVIFNDYDLNIGDSVKCEAKLQSVDDEYKNLYYGEGIYLRANIEDFERIDKNDKILKAVMGIRKYIKKTIFSNLEYSNSSTVTALILGDDSYFNESFAFNIKASGVSHIMVVSGMHLSVFVLVFTYFIEKLFYNRYLRGIMIFSAVIFIVAVCGFTPSMLRAGVTYMLMSFALFFNRNSLPENSLGAALTLILIFSPFTIVNIGFLLSVFATFGILAIALPTLNYIRNRNIIKGKLVFGLITLTVLTLSATLMTLPVTVGAFGQISTVAVITNILISSAVSVVIWVTVIALLVNLLFPHIARLTFYLIEFVVEYINRVINHFGELRFSYIAVPKITFILAIFLIILIFSVMLACKKRIDMVKLKEIKKKQLRKAV